MLINSSPVRFIQHIKRNELKGGMKHALDYGDRVIETPRKQPRHTVHVRAPFTEPFTEANIKRSRERGLLVFPFMFDSQRLRALNNKEREDALPIPLLFCFVGKSTVPVLITPHNPLYWDPQQHHSKINLFQNFHPSSFNSLLLPA